MIVQKGDFLERGGNIHRVVCCDEEVFIVGKVECFEDHFMTRYDSLEAYSNDESINSLEELQFTKIN